MQHQQSQQYYGRGYIPTQPPPVVAQVPGTGMVQIPMVPPTNIQFLVQMPVQQQYQYHPYQGQPNFVTPPPVVVPPANQIVFGMQQQQPVPVSMHHNNTNTVITKQSNGSVYQQQQPKKEKKCLTIQDPTKGNAKVVLTKEKKLPIEKKPTDPNSLQKERAKNELRQKVTQAVNDREAVGRESNPSPAPSIADNHVQSVAVYSRQNSISSSSRLEDNNTPTGTDLLQISEDHSNVDTEDTRAASVDGIDEPIDDAKMEELRQQIEALTMQKTLQNNPSEKIYGTDFMITMRDYIKGTRYRYEEYKRLSKSFQIQPLSKKEEKDRYKSTKNTTPEQQPAKEERQNKFSNTSEFQPPWYQKQQPPHQTGIRFNARQPPPYAGRGSAGSSSSKYGRPPNKKFPFAGRTSFNNQRPQSPMTGPPTASSDNQQPTPAATESNASITSVAAPTPTSTTVEPPKKKWKPMRRALEGASEEEQKHEKLKMQIRGILNKITPSTFDELANDFCAVKVYEDATLLPKIIDLIFEKAVEEPHFCALYADLCVRQVNKEREETKSKSRFGNALIQKCQDTFQSDKKANDEVEQQKVGTDTKEGIQQEKQSTSEEEWAKEKRRLHGIIQLIACLYLQRQLPLFIILWCCAELTTKGYTDETYLEFAVSIVEKIGDSYQKDIKRLEQLEIQKRQKEAEEAEKKEKAKTLAQKVQTNKKVDKTAPTQIKVKEQEEMEKVFTMLSSFKQTVSKRTRFMILNMEELRERNWEPRCEEKGPKTIEEIHEQAQREKQHAEAERAAYEVKKEEERQKAHPSSLHHKSSFQTGNRRPPPHQYQNRDRPFYGGRHSYDHNTPRPSYSNTTNINNQRQAPSRQLANQYQNPKPTESRIRNAHLSELADANAPRKKWGEQTITRTNPPPAESRNNDVRNVHLSEIDNAPRKKYEHPATRTNPPAKSHSNDVRNVPAPSSQRGDDDEPSNKDWKPQKPVTLLKKKEPQMEQKPDEN